MRILMLIFLALIFTDVQSQDIKVTYNVRPLIDSTRIENADWETRERLMEKAKGESYELMIREGVSLYEPLALKKDITNETSKRSGNVINNNVHVVHRYDETIYLDKSKKEKVSSIRFGGETFLITESFKPIDWKILEETKKIDSYIVRKAEATVNGDHVVVWFSDQIPISAGPRYYTGLPGLILQAQFGKKLVTATKIEPLPEGVSVVPPTEGEKYTREEYNSLMDGLMNRKEGTIRKGNTTTTITRH